MVTESQTIRVRKKTYNFINGKGKRGESFDDIIVRLLEIK